MRKYVLLGVLAILLVAIPAAVAAIDASVPVSGDTIKTLDCGISSSNIPLGGTSNIMGIGLNPNPPLGDLSATATVTATGAGTVNTWQVNVQDQVTDPIYRGWLLDRAFDPNPHYLTNALKFSWGSGWSDLTVPRTILSGTAPTISGSTPVYFQQQVIPGDPAGHFTMTVQVLCVILS